MRAAALVALVLATMQPAHAFETDAVLGIWQQVGSNAGACPTCSVEFGADGQGLIVTANNGWSARLHGSGTGIDGAGRWTNVGNAWVSGQPFTISFHLERERLDMVMTVETDTGQRRVVRGSFRRAWQGV